MPRKKTPRRPKKQNQQYLTLNAAIGIVGVLLLGFIYSFSQNSLHRGIPIEVNFPKSDEPRRLAAASLLGSSLFGKLTSIGIPRCNEF